MLSLARRDRLVDRLGIKYEVLAVHPPYNTARKRRGTAVTVLRLDDERAFLITIADLEREGYQKADSQAA